MSDFSKEFRDLAARFLRLRADDLPDEVGHRATRRAEAAGAQIIKRAVDFGLLRALAERFPGPPNDAVSGPAWWANAFVGAVQWLQFQMPDRLPPDLGAFRVENRTIEGGKIKEFRVMLPEDWKQRCEDWARVCLVLAELVAPEIPAAAANKPNRGKKINAQMLVETQKNAGCHGWTCGEWARLLGCTTAAVTKTQTWLMLSGARDALKGEREWNFFRRR